MRHATLFTAIAVAFATTAHAQSRIIRATEVSPSAPQAQISPTNPAPVVPPTQTTLPSNPAPVPGVATVLPADKTAVRHLSPTEQKRITALREWERTGVAEALIGQNGSIEYPYGYSRPVISCAPLHICTIILQPGEAITSLSLGDTVRWLAQQSTAGNKPVIVVKPTQAAISTNMVATTDAGRVYYMHLVADKEQYVPIVTFYDPVSMVRQEQSAEAARIAADARAKALAEKRDQEVIASFKPGFDPAKLDFDYRCRGTEDLLPARVFATDTHTYVQMHPSIKAKDAPGIFAMRSDQTTELVNMRVKGDYYIIDGKPSMIRMMLGVGRDQAVVTCERRDGRQ